MKFSRKEVLLLATGIGFLIIWILDLNSPTPPEIKNNFWANIFYHYSWLMFAVGFLFYFQYAKYERVKKQEANQQKEGESEESRKQAERKALQKGKK